MQISLKGVVVSQYGSASAFARKLNWSGRKARDIVSGRQIPTVTDVEEMALALSITDNDEFMRVFFAGLSK
ncbi:MAG: hypothetical protein VB087_05945 [Candidatus Limiplasma sp.]|nr:hypothetical protein [Candidatus Limiplasma sp.]